MYKPYESEYMYMISSEVTCLLKPRRKAFEMTAHGFFVLFKSQVVCSTNSCKII